ncbi:haloalkane dehalogenase [Tsukamurella pulmonis]|uniref:Haloalkane dehalogenase n=1 Tax=Tsukamurella pulmonis TaxID=47312 RepID=A0A1H1FMZ1_9ACTN|nr:alpha/beta fold hydrolase [Tsukamurella pulmonis]KXO87596.1 haloalkane dehalogenase [Tsukamurella pulmonis]KXP10525.1 haloalkane dehalogenase [Tsukamurella pulmonis]RDH12577.1 alpha/beta fold hydrolase [Tsukamurella pulmonis]SDR02291.1 haloalkane dehalogenase [Tsukamurella pulmonis]SUP18727.1 Haloalkane dehalogenase [Tsukamurella pulmonis]
MFVDFRPDPDLYPFESRWCETDAGTMHYVDEGRGPVLLFCHGTPTWSFLYRRIIAELRARYRCIAVDNLGFGLSERPAGCGYTIPELSSALGRLVDRLGLDDFVVVGHDWGGPIALDVAVERADRVRGVVLANTTYGPNRAFSKRLFSAAMSSRFAQRQILEKNLMIDRILVSELSRVLARRELEHYRAVQSTPSARVALAVMPREIRDADSFLAGLESAVPAALGRKPALAIWGMRDPVFRPHAHLPQLRRDFAGIEVVEIAQAGHAVQEFAPGEFAGAIARRFPVAGD